jgi:hypothetical protein
MARGAFLEGTLLPLLREHLRPEHSARAWERFQRMRHDYRLDAQPAVDPGALG